MSRILRHLRRRSAIALSLALVGVMAAVPSASAAAAPADGHRAGAGEQRFLVVSTDYTDESPTVLAYGPIHAKGTDVVVSDTVDRFKFPDGTIRVAHHVTKGSQSQHTDKDTCTTTYRERGTYRITGGTGDYQGASGSGHYRVDVLWVGCDMNSAPDIFILKIKAQGSIDF